jgi:hypothetical protein
MTAVIFITTDRAHLRSGAARVVAGASVGAGQLGAKRKFISGDLANAFSKKLSHCVAGLMMPMERWS